MNQTRRDPIDNNSNEKLCYDPAFDEAESLLVMNLTSIIKLVHVDVISKHVIKLLLQNW